MTTKYAVRPDRLAALDQLNLSYGSHREFEDGHCAMEVVAWLAGQGHTDAPACASPVIARFTTSVNDSWDDQQRQKLKPYLPRMVGTWDDGLDEARAYLALDWLVRVYTPEWLDLAGLTGEARGLRELSQIVDLATALAASTKARKARYKASVIWTASTAAEDAAGDAAWDASRDAAIWAAARSAAEDAAGDAAWDASRGAAWDALRPTVETLQASALDLLDAMIDPSRAVQA